MQDSIQCNQEQAKKNSIGGWRIVKAFKSYGDLGGAGFFRQR